MYTIRIKEIRTGEISFDTLEEAKQWHENREGDVFCITMMKDATLKKQWMMMDLDQWLLLKILVRRLIGYEHI